MSGLGSILEPIIAAALGRLIEALIAAILEWLKVSVQTPEKTVALIAEMTQRVANVNKAEDKFAAAAELSAWATSLTSVS